MQSAAANLVEFLERMGQTYSPQSFLVNQWIELALVAFLFTLLCVLCLKASRLTRRFRTARQNMAAAGYAVILYRGQPHLMLRNIGRLLWSSGVSLLYLGPTLLASGVAFGLLWGSLTNRYAFGPVKVATDVVIQTQSLAPSLHTIDSRVEHVELVTVASVRVPTVGSWRRLHALAPGIYPLHVGTNSFTALNVGIDAVPAMPRTISGGARITIAYPPRRWLGWRHGWLIYFLTVCLVSAVPLSRWLRVRL